MTTAAMKPETFERYWGKFAESQLSGLGPRELAAARTVFFAGGMALFGIVTEKVGAMEESEACATMDALASEFLAFIDGRIQQPEH